MQNKELQAETKADSEQMPIDTTSSPNAAKPNVGRSLSYDALAVIIKTKDGKYLQVALNKEMCDCLFTELKNYFKESVVKVLPNEIAGITF